MLDLASRYKAISPGEATPTFAHHRAEDLSTVTTAFDITPLSMNGGEVQESCSERIRRLQLKAAPKWWKSAIQAAENCWTILERYPETIPESLYAKTADYDEAQRMFRAESELAAKLTFRDFRDKLLIDKEGFMSAAADAALNMSVKRIGDTIADLVAGVNQLPQDGLFTPEMQVSICPVLDRKDGNVAISLRSTIAYGKHHKYTKAFESAAFTSADGEKDSAMSEAVGSNVSAHTSAPPAQPTGSDSAHPWTRTAEDVLIGQKLLEERVIIATRPDQNPKWAPWWFDHMLGIAVDTALTWGKSEGYAAFQSAMQETETGREMIDFKVQLSLHQHSRKGMSQEEISAILRRFQSTMTTRWQT